jgi:REP element-mobilizing transposase RayT
MTDAASASRKSDSARNKHNGWTSRGYLPHFDVPNLIQGLTFHLGDSLPAHMRAETAEDPELKTDSQRRARIEAYLNAGYGACYLRDPRVGEIVENALLHFEGRRYQLFAWVVMPNHVHVMIQVQEGFPLRGIVQSWKSFTAKAANRILHRSGNFWFADYFDRFIRDADHFAHAIAYIHDNPVKAGLVAHPADWTFTSARFSRSADVSSASLR